MNPPIEPIQELAARDFVSDTASVVETAEVVAVAINERLLRGEHVRLSMRGFPGTSSSFFNLVLRRVIEVNGINALEKRVQFDFATTIEAELFGRSLRATKKNIASICQPASHSS